MKKRINKIFGVGVLVSVVIAMLASPASAGTLSWSPDTTVPSTTDNILVTTAGTDIVDIAVSSDGQMVIAATGGNDARLYKSVDKGATFTALTAPTNTDNTSNLVAIAPDDSSIIVVFGGTNNLDGHVSTNGGSTWSSLGTVQEATAGTDAVAIYDIAISALTGSTRYIAAAGHYGAAATAVYGDDAPGLYFFNLGAAAPVWKNATISGDMTFGTGWTFPAAIDTFRAVEFSPNFASDNVLTAVSETIGNNGAAEPGYMKFHMVSFNLKKWDDDAGFGSYPKTIDGSTSANETFCLVTADISLDPMYLGGDDTSRIAFIGASTTLGGAESGGIFRLKNTSLKELTSSAEGFKSVAWDGTNLVAGPTLDNNVKHVDDALASSPTVSSSRSNKRPGIDATGNDNVIVRWAGTDVVAAKSGNESAFSISKDNGLTFNDISLIDTALSDMLDVWVTPDGSKVFLVADDGTDTSVFRKASSWQRILTLSNQNGYIVRGAPNDNDVLYVADNGGTVMYYTKDGGESKWFNRASRYTIADLAVESVDVSYVARDGTKDISKTTNGGFTWATAVSTRLASGNIHTIASISEDNLLVGSTDGYVSYSTDGGSTWIKVGSPAKQIETGAGATQITASGLADGDFIYAVTAKSGGTVRRWEIGTSTSWKDLEAGVATGFAGRGIALVNGILYVQTDNTTSSVTYRTLSPTGSSVYWSAMTEEADATFNLTPSALRAGTGSIKLYSIDTYGTHELSTYTDAIADTAPTLTQPADLYQNPMNPITGHSVDIGFGWEKPADYVTGYELCIYTDSAAKTRVAQHFYDSTSSSLVQVLGPNQSSATTRFVEFNPGTTYYWRVRVRQTGPTYSPWSEIRSFTVEPGIALVPNLLSPENGTEASKTPSFSWAPVAGATEYQFVLANNVSLSPPIVDVRVKTTGFEMTKELVEGQTYYWAVKPIVPVEGGWSTVANFTVKVPAPEPKPPVTVKEYPPPQITIPPSPAPPPDIIIPPAPQPPAPITPAFIWAIIIIGAVLVIAVIVLIIRTRRAV
jgi:hypothetical protein